MQNYKKHIFGNKNRIYLYLLDTPIEKGVLGLIKSKLFEKYIGIYIPQNEETEETQYSFGGIYISSHQQQPMIEVSKDLYNKEKIGFAFLLTIFHELGHYYNGDLNNLKRNNDELRLLAIEKSTVLQAEEKADEFAMKYLGKKKVISGLEELKNSIKSIEYADSYTTQLAIMELDMRIQIIINSFAFYTSHHNLSILKSGCLIYFIVK